MKSQLIKVAMMVAVLFAFATLPVQAAPPFPPAPPLPHGVCDQDGACALVCHVPDHNGRHWMWVQMDHLDQFLATHPADYVYRAQIDEVECAEYHGWFIVGWPTQ